MNQEVDVEKNTSSLKILRALHWTKTAGAKALGCFRSVQAQRKGDNSFVTEADRDIEQYLRGRIRTHYPNDRIVGEEEQTREGEGETWYLDPIDGTAAYCTELPIWAVSVAFGTGVELSGGVLYAPCVDDCYVTDGNDVRRNGQPVERTGQESWDRETLLCVPSDSHRRYQINFPGKTRCLGSTAYHMAMAVDGRALAALIGRTRIWDTAAVLAMGLPRDMVLRGVETNSEPDWDRFLDGKRPEEPLLFGKRETVRRLQKRINTAE